MRKTTRKKIPPIIMTVLVIAYIAPMMLMVLYMAGLLDSGGNVRLMFPFLCWLIVGGAVIVGVLKALRERLREIDGGEEEDASQY